MTQRYYTVLSGESNVPFGFGSSSPARPPEMLIDTPGPGKYEPKPLINHFESIRGHGNGFASRSKRKLEFIKGDRNPDPSKYVPEKPKVIPKRTIGVIPRGMRVSCFPDERETSSTPGPGSYSLPPLPSRDTSHVFKSRVERKYLPDPSRKGIAFDGRNLIISNVF